LSPPQALSRPAASKLMDSRDTIFFIKTPCN
jgi:hypothetical protein